MKILVVEDDSDINYLLKKLLECENCMVLQAYSGSEAQLRLSIEDFDVVLLDLMIPGISGEELLPQISAKGIPVIVISAKIALKDRIHALNLGADDYITKPFEGEEVWARINAVLRRTGKNVQSGADQSEYRVKNLTLDTQSRRITVCGREMPFTVHEFDIIALMMKNPKMVFPRQKLYEEVWQGGYYGEDNTVNVHISNIRKKLAEIDSQNEYIKTVWGIGFKMET